MFATVKSSRGAVTAVLLIALQRVRWPSTAQVVGVLQDAIASEGAQQRILTDRGPIFRSEEWTAFLAARSIEHTLTLPAHPWTNGRIERLFRTFKETVSGVV